MEARPGSSAPSSTRLFTMQYIFSLFFSVRRFENVLFCRNLLPGDFRQHCRLSYHDFPVTHPKQPSVASFG
jgi:hypothetical protein